MKKKSLIVLISSIVVALGVALTVVLVVTSHKKPTPELTYFVDNGPIVNKLDLARPRNLSFTNEKLTWDNVKNADSYVVNVDEQEFIVSSNEFALSNVSNDKSVIFVRAKASGCADSALSLKVCYVKNVSSEELSKVNGSISQFFQSHNLEISQEEATGLANALCYLGLSSEEAETLFENIDAFINNVNGKKNIMSSSMTSLFDSFSKLLSMDILEYQTINSLKDVFSLYLEKRVSQVEQQVYVHTLSNTNYYEENELEDCFTKTVNALKALSEETIQNISYSLYFAHLEGKQLENIFALFAGSGILSENLYDDLMTILDVVLKSLKSTLPIKVEYDSVVSTFEKLFESLSEKYLKEEIEIQDLKNYLMNAFEINNHVLGFIASLEKNDVRLVVSYLKTLYLSISEEDRNDLIETVTNLKNVNQFVEYALTSVKTNLEALEFNKEFFKGLAELENVNEFIDYIEFNEYFALSEESLNKMIDYVLGLLPESISDFNTFIQYLQEALTEIDFMSCLSFDQEGFINSLNLENILSALSSGAGVAGLFNELNIENYININRDKLMDQVSTTMNEKFGTLINFVENDLFGDYSATLSKMGITEEVKFNVKGFVENLLELTGLKNFTVGNVEEAFNNISSDLTSYVNDNYPYLDRIDTIISLVSALNMMAEGADYSSNDMSSIMDSGFDYLTMYNLYNLLNNRYAKFSAKYVPVYSMLSVDNSNLSEILLASNCYYYFGIDAYYYDDIVVDALNISMNAISTLMNYQLYLDKYSYYQELLNKYATLDYQTLWENQEYFTQIINDACDDVHNAYNDLLMLKDTICMDDLNILVLHVADLLESYDKEESSLLVFVNDLSIELCDSLFASLEKANESFEEKAETILSLYSDLHALVDPIYAFVEESKALFEDVAEEDLFESLSGYLVSKTDTIVGFYDRSLIEQIGEDLSAVFENSDVDFGTPVETACDYLESLIEKIRDLSFFPAVFDDAELLMDTLDEVSAYKEQLDSDIENINALSEQETINFSDLSTAYTTLINDAKSYENVIKPNIITIATHIENFLDVDVLSIVNGMFDEIDAIIDGFDDVLPSEEELIEYGLEYAQQMIEDYIEDMMNYITESVIYQTAVELVNAVTDAIVSAIQEFISQINLAPITDAVNYVIEYFGSLN